MMTKIFAHRGASGYAPENTLEAFALAMEMGADGIELDVQLTKDGEVVVIHDEVIDRVSNGKGLVKDYTLVQLRKFSFDNHMEGYENISIPTLKEVLELVKASKMEVNIELKTGIYWYLGLEEKVLEIVKNREMHKRVIYSSFNHYSVQKIKELDQKAETAYLYSDVILNVENYAKEKSQAAHRVLPNCGYVLCIPVLLSSVSSPVNVISSYFDSTIITQIKKTAKCLFLKTEGSELFPYKIPYFFLMRSNFRSIGPARKNRNTIVEIPCTILNGRPLAYIAASAFHENPVPNIVMEDVSIKKP